MLFDQPKRARDVMRRHVIHLTNARRRLVVAQPNDDGTLVTLVHVHVRRRVLPRGPEYHHTQIATANDRGHQKYNRTLGLIN